MPALAHAELGTEGLDRFFRHINTFKAQFIQQVLDDRLTIIDEAYGSVWIQRPGRFRWDYDPPDELEIVGDGERVWLYDIALEQVTVRKQSEVIGQMPANLLASMGELEGAYEIQDIGQQGQLNWISLIPSDSRSTFVEIQLGFANEQLTQIELIDTLEQRTRIRFIEVAENTVIADSIFDFQPPAGVDIIE